MNAHSPALVAAAGLLAGVASATDTEPISPPVEVTATRSSVYWTTHATDTARPLVCAWPANASSATLTVTGGGSPVTKTFTRAAGEAWLEIPASDESLAAAFAAPASVADERLLTLALAFDSGETATAKVAVVCGAGGSDTRVLTAKDGDDAIARAWQKVTRRRALIPILDADVETVSLDGTEVPAGLDGYPGWYFWTDIPAGLRTFAAADRTATLLSIQDGTAIFLR